MTVTQLTIDGREVSHPPSTGDLRHHPRLTLLQLGILAHVQDHGFITSTEAGMLAHRFRGSCGTPGAHRWQPLRYYGGEGTSEACCGLAATDGSAACSRLARRGYLHRQRWLGWRRA